MERHRTGDISHTSSLSVNVSSRIIEHNSHPRTWRPTADHLQKLLYVYNNETRAPSIIFGGDFRQTLPVIAKGSRDDIVNASFRHSPLWQHVTKFSLTMNMRARADPDFASFLLDVGNGDTTNEVDDTIQLDPSICLPYTCPESSLNNLINTTYPSLDDFAANPSQFSDRAILCPKNRTVDELNSHLLSKFPGEACKYISKDVTTDSRYQLLYQDFINDIQLPGFPDHCLFLKPNYPVMLLRNLNPSEGLSNGTRLICNRLEAHVIGATIASGEHKGEFVFIPRIPLEPSDSLKCPVPFKRYQFPVKLCFAMTINKSQGQTLDSVGVYLPEPVFSYGQLYVSLSRAKTRERLRVLICPSLNNTWTAHATRNIVYREVLQP